MKTLIENKFSSSEEEYLNMALRSTSGANIRVDNRLYSVSLNRSGGYFIEEFIPEFELSEEEFKKFIKK